MVRVAATAKNRRFMICHISLGQLTLLEDTSQLLQVVAQSREHAPCLQVLFRRQLRSHSAGESFCLFLCWNVDRLYSRPRQSVCIHTTPSWDAAFASSQFPRVRIWAVL